MSLSTQNTKIISMAVRAHARYSYMLTADDYWKMLNLKSIAQITEFLKETKTYSKPLHNLTPTTTHRTMLENTLRSALFYEEEQFLSNLKDECKYTFFLSIMRRSESDHLKNIFRRIKTHELGREALYAFLKHIPGSDMPYSRLIACADYCELLDCLRDTCYYEVLKEPVGKLIDGITASLFETETAIDHYVESGVFNALEMLDKTDCNYLLPLFGTFVDGYNIYNLHRCIVYYNMTPDEVMKALLPIYFKIKQEDLRVMAEEKNKEVRLEILKKRSAFYSKPFEICASRPDNEFMLETLLLRNSYNACLQVFKSGTPGFHTIICYFMMKMYEIADIVRITEAVRYECPPIEATEYLIRPVLDGGASKWL